MSAKYSLLAIFWVQYQSGGGGFARSGAAPGALSWCCWVVSSRPFSAEGNMVCTAECHYFLNFSLIGDFRSRRIHGNTWKYLVYILVYMSTSKDLGVAKPISSHFHLTSTLRFSSNERKQCWESLDRDVESFWRVNVSIWGAGNA